MIPEEVAQIAMLLRNRYPSTEDPEEDFDYSITVAWEIHNLIKEYEKVHLEGSY